MDAYSIRAAFADGSERFYATVGLGPCTSMQEVLTHISEFEQPESELVSLSVISFDENELNEPAEAMREADSPIFDEDEKPTYTYGVTVAIRRFYRVYVETKDPEADIAALAREAALDETNLIPDEDLGVEPDDIQVGPWYEVHN